MANSKLILAHAVAVAMVLCSMHPPTFASNSTVAPYRNSSGGKEFFSWVGKALPELALKLMSCLKKNDKEVRTSVQSLFSDVGRCFDESKGSVMATTECLLTNSVPRIISTMNSGQKVLSCAIRRGQDYRLCVSLVEPSDRTCPFAIGL